MTEDDKQMMNDGVPEPDIVTEAKAIIGCLVMLLCAVLCCAVVCGLCWCIEQIIRALC